MQTTGSFILPPQASTVAAEVDALFHFIMNVAAFFFVVVIALLVYFVLKYRRTRAGKITSSKSHHTVLEILWSGIPAVIVIILFIWGFRLFLKMSIVPRDALEIKVTASRWSWKFDYADGTSSVGELVAPLGRPIKLLMSSADVIHSFYVPEFRIKKDVLPNRYTVAWFEATKTGDFDLFCAEYCGTGHSQMLGKVRIVPPDQYEKWLEEMVLAQGDTGSLAQRGQRLYLNRGCHVCHSTDGTPKVGPSLAELFGRAVDLSDGKTVIADENYLRESILNPQAKIVGGFAPVMPTYQGLVDERELDALVAYIKALSKEGTQ